MVQYSPAAAPAALDETDRAILQILQVEGDISNAALARRVHLSPPATHARVRRLEEQGYIRQYAALLDREKLGLDLLCFIQISMQVHHLAQQDPLREAIQELPEVLECHHLTGEYDYLLKVVVRNRQELERLVVGRLTTMPGVARIHTSLVFTEIKATTALPLA